MNTCQPNSERLSQEPQVDVVNIETVQRDCEKHGAYRARLIVVVEGMDPVIEDCPMCREADAAAAQRSADRAAQRLRSEKIKGLLSVASIPPRFAGASFDTYEVTSTAQRRVLTICQTFARTWPEQMGKGGTLILTGAPGNGKTHLACAIANAVMAQFEATVAYGNVPDLLRTIKETYRRDSTRTERQALQDLIGPDLLVMDELGAQMGTDHEKQLLFEIIDRRYTNLRPTIIASNLNREDLDGYLGQRAMDRFDQTATILAFDWESYRSRRPGI